MNCERIIKFRLTSGFTIKMCIRDRVDTAGDDDERHAEGHEADIIAGFENTLDRIERQEVIAEDCKHDIQNDQRSRREQLLHLSLIHIFWQDKSRKTVPASLNCRNLFLNLLIEFSPVGRKGLPDHRDGLSTAMDTVAFRVGIRLQMLVDEMCIRDRCYTESGKNP